MQIDIEKIVPVENADGIFLAPEGEQVLLDVLEVERQLEDVKQAIKEQLARRAAEINPNFKMIQGEKVKVYYRQYGTRYVVEPGLEEKVPVELVQTEVKYRLKISELEGWIEQHGGKLPYGVRSAEREKQITFALVKEGDGDGE